jgi:hypothetical protein
MADNDDPKYPVGYKKPPRQTQFKPGQSGNAKGRPKGAKNFATVFEKELRTPIDVTENGKRKRMSKREAVAKQAVNKAVTGDPKAIVVVLNEARFYENQNQLPVPQDAIVSPEDQIVMDNIVRRIRQADPAVPDPHPPSDPPSEDQPDRPPQSNDEGES